MRNRTVVLLILSFVISCFTLYAGAARASGLPPAEGDTFPEILLPSPQKWSEREYLGLDHVGPFKISQVKADTLIIEVFSMYCPYCQKEAPVVNELHQMILSRSDLRNKIKMIGIGAGNSQFEVNAFRNLYGIVFPLFPDPDFSLHKALGDVRTPYFIVVNLKGSGSHKVIYSRVGSFGDPRQFLESISRKSGPRKGA
jgi:thiol-disulfide isomerase/thioredoxin